MLGLCFQKTLTELDNADIRLNQTLNLLRNSEVDPAFQSPDAAQQGDANASAAPSASAPAAASEERARAATGGAGNYPNSDTSEDTPAIARPRVLHDFVEDEGIENLKSRLRHSIDYVQVRPIPPHPPSLLPNPPSNLANHKGSKGTGGTCLGPPIRAHTQ